MKLRNRTTRVHGDYQVISAGNLIRVRDYASDESWQYNCLADFNDKWEDYTPVEPLIKDEKIRKAVRAWAEANDIKEIIIFDSSNNAPYTPVGAVEFVGNASRLKVLFRTEERFDTNMIYTIEELCGEDKPRPVIVNDIKYSSYEDYLESRKEKKCEN